MKKKLTTAEGIKSCAGYGSNGYKLRCNINPLEVWLFEHKANRRLFAKCCEVSALTIDRYLSHGSHIVSDKFLRHLSFVTGLGFVKLKSWRSPLVHNRQEISRSSYFRRECEERELINFHKESRRFQDLK